MQMRFPGGKSKALTFSYDDGEVRDIRLARLFTKYGMKCTFNLNSGSIIDSREIRENPQGRLTWGEAQEYIVSAGHEAAVHTLTHPWIATLSAAEAVYEVAEDRRNIEKNLGVIARGMAYPFGCYTEETADVLKKCGIAYSRTTKATHSFLMPENPLTLHPTCHHSDGELTELAKRFAEEDPKWDIPAMFYVWGHSFEFRTEEDWKRMEDLCAYLAGREDIWYAANIEIIDYAEAYSRLKFSYDRKTVFNPSAIPVWFSQNGIRCVNPGETVSTEN